MNGHNAYDHLFVDAAANAVDNGSSPDSGTLTPDERKRVRKLGRKFAKQQGGVWLLINGRFTPDGDTSTDNVMKQMLLRAFGYPSPEPYGPTIHVLLNSPGGSLDSAYTTALYLNAYTKDLRVYVPNRAKSASTLLAIGADTIYLSAFGELGPLDTQIPNPRNPANSVSALDCYQSVDYVRDFGFNTISAVLPKLIESTGRRIPVSDLLATASTFAIGAVEPVLRTITALDFGGWGRSLRIGEQYARMLLQAKSKDGDHVRADRIARTLVYGYTHHPFPIDFHEAKQIGLEVSQMDGNTYEAAAAVLDACRQKTFVGFLSEREAKMTAHTGDSVSVVSGNGAVSDHAQADAGMARGWASRNASADA